MTNRDPLTVQNRIEHIRDLIRIVTTEDKIKVREILARVRQEDKIKVREILARLRQEAKSNQKERNA